MFKALLIAGATALGVAMTGSTAEANHLCYGGYGGYYGGPAYYGGGYPAYGYSTHYYGGPGFYSTGYRGVSIGYTSGYAYPRYYRGGYGYPGYYGRGYGWGYPRRGFSLSIGTGYGYPGYGYYGW